MSIELTIIGVTLIAVLLMIGHAWWTLPESKFVPETIDIGHVASALPPPTRRDVLDDYADALNFDGTTAERSADYRLALLDALLQEADHETVRLELLVDKLGQQLTPSA